jgi:GNAT superfamily N-acetyltransferase
VDTDVRDPHADWPDRRAVRDPSGAVLLAYSRAESASERLPWADGVWRAPGVGVDDAVRLMLDAMRGWLASTSDPQLSRALLATGATQRRHAFTMTTPLSSLPPARTPEGVRIEPLRAGQVDRHALRLGALHLQAYPPGHPDAFDGDEAAAVSQIRSIARGEILGSMLPESRIALYDGQIAGACLLVDRPGTPPYGGPWVLDLFRDRAAPVRGIGAALLSTAMAAGREAGFPGLSLVVSAANAHARRLYLGLGFRDVEDSWTLALPRKDERPGSLSGVGSPVS